MFYPPWILFPGAVAFPGSSLESSSSYWYIHQSITGDFQGKNEPWYQQYTISIMGCTGSSLPAYVPLGLWTQTWRQHWRWSLPRSSLRSLVFIVPTWENGMIQSMNTVNAWYVYHWWVKIELPWTWWWEIGLGEVIYPASSINSRSLLCRE